ncbi:MAG TPA: helix-turn-helix domain-containing protein [Pilimelia sp.]|nr:helix-turn-helix domain-containing protein [Pilimelia sp.]
MVPEPRIPTIGSPLVDTAAHPPEDRGDVWEHAVSNAFVPLTITPGHPTFRGSLHARQLGPVQVCDLWAGAHTAERTAKLVAQSGGDFYKVGVGVSGSCIVRQDGRESVIGPGSVLLYDTTRPYRVEVPREHRIILLLFPRQALDLPPQRVATLTASTLPGSTALGELVTPFLAGLAEADVSGPAAERLAAGALNLVAALLAERLDLSVPLSDDLMWERITQHADRHLGDPDLGPPALAAAHHVSVRQLQRLFHRRGTTVSGWLRRRRLEQVRRDLVDRALADRPIWALASRAGFADPAHFSRAFRAAYGQSPRDYRAGRAASSGPADGDRAAG